jgi:hypothetical protein
MDRETSANLKPVFRSSMAEILPTGGDAVIAFRIGHPTTIADPSPRRPMDDVLSA